jgi:leucyl-tRNA synthetase
VTLGVQVNGKMRGKVELAPDAPQDEAMALAMEQEAINKFVVDPEAIKKIIYVPGKILNIVAPPAKK